MFWKNLFTSRLEHRAIDDANLHPQAEYQLNRLYVAITRSVNKLVFIETFPSLAGKAFFAWMKEEGNNLAVELKPELATAIKTADDWRIEGVAFACLAQGNPDVKNALSAIQEATRQFERANDADLLRLARAHSASLVFRKRLEAMGNEATRRLAMRDEEEGRRAYERESV